MPALARSYPRRFTFYLAHPIRSIPGFVISFSAFRNPELRRWALDVCFSVDYTFGVSTVEEIRTAIPKLSVEEKLQTMEALWQSLSSKPDAVESPAWHEKELRDRERDIESGKSKFIDWEKAKADIRRQTS